MMPMQTLTKLQIETIYLAQPNHVSNANFCVFSQYILVPQNASRPTQIAMLLGFLLPIPKDLLSFGSMGKQLKADNLHWFACANIRKLKLIFSY